MTDVLSGREGLRIQSIRIDFPLHRTTRLGVQSFSIVDIDSSGQERCTPTAFSNMLNLIGFGGEGLEL